MTGRPPNPPINFRNEKLVAIMNLFDKYFFKDEDSFKLTIAHAAVVNRARFISKTASSFKVDLNYHELRKKLFQPFQNEVDITLSKIYIERICVFLSLAAEEYGFKESIDDINAFKNIHQTTQKNFEVLESKHEFTPQRNLITRMLTNGLWYIFERIGDHHIKDDDFGIAIGDVSFTIKGDEVRTSMQFTYEGNERVYSGGVSFDDSYDYMYLDLMLDGSGKRATVTLRLAEYDSIHQTIILGHFTYHSKLYSHLITKAVVLQRCSSSSIKLIRGDVNYADPLYKSINPEISKFLYSRDKNRLSLPRKIISNEKELSSFLTQQTKKINPILKKHFQGSYRVYYKNFKGVIVEDNLDIKLNPNASTIEATYIHHPDISQKNKKKWRGTTYLNSRFIVLELSEVRSPERKAEEDPILLTFYTSDEDITFSECECFPGLVSGLQDSLRAPVSYICLVVREDLSNFEGVRDSRLGEYFERSENTNLTPSILAFRLDKLSE